MLKLRKYLREPQFIYTAIFVLAFFVLAGVALAQKQDFGLAEAGQNLPLPGQNTDVREIILNVIRYALGFLGLASVILVIYGGVLWLTAGGDQTKVDKAKRIFKNAAIGLAIILLSFAIVQWLFSSLQKVLDITPGEGGSAVGGFGDSLGGKFKVVSYQPDGEAVPLCAKAQAIFNSTLDKSYAKTEAVQILPNGSGPISGTIAVNKNVLSFSHADFLPNTVYNVVLKNSLRDLDGRTLDKDTAWSFTTAASRPGLAKVTKTSPKANQANVCLSKSLQIKFSEIMDLASFDASNVLLTDDKDQAVAVRIEPMTDFKGLTILPQDNLAKNTKYSLRLKASGFANACGEGLDGNGNGKNDGSPADDYVLNFTTGTDTECRPILYSVTPTADYYNNTALVVVGQNLGLGGNLFFGSTDATGNYCGSQSDFVLKGKSCILEWADDYITTKAPVGADDGEIKVALGDKQSNGIWFEIKSPVVFKTSPDGRAPVGQWVTVWGKNFGTSGRVWLIDPTGKKIATNKTGCVVGTDWTDKAVVFEVPAVGVGKYQVGVETSGKFSNLIPLEIVAGTPGPGVCVLSPACGSSAQATILKGKNFGAKQDTGNIVVGGNKVSVISRWADTSVNFNMPNLNQAGRYSLLVEKNGLASNSVPYTVPCAAPPQLITQNNCSPTDTQSPSPASGAVDVCLGVMPSARFTADMLDSDLLSLTKMYQCAGAVCTTAVPFKIYWLKHNLPGEGLALLPTNALKPNTIYQVVIKGGGRTANKESALGSDISWKFTTGSKVCTARDLVLSPIRATIKLNSTQDFTPLLQSDLCQLNFSSKVWPTVDQGGYVNWSKNGDGVFSIRGDQITDKDVKLIFKDPIIITDTIVDIKVIPPDIIPPPEKVPYCGDGLVNQAGEQCDGGNNCDSSCKYKITASGECPNGKVACKPNDTWACSLNGYKSGTVKCTASCQVDSSNCSNYGPGPGPDIIPVPKPDPINYPSCGDGKVNQSYEDCDLGSKNGAVGSACTTYCQNVPAQSCNRNGKVETGEFCDGADLAGKSCSNFGFTGGSLSCASNCEFNTSACTTSNGGKDIIDGPYCGDKIVQGNEECDGGNNCDSNCKFKITPIAQCPNGNVACKPGETWACALNGYKSGTVKCTASCQVDESDCVRDTVIVPPGGIGSSCTVDAECAPNFGADVQCGEAQGVCSGGLCSNTIKQCPLGCNNNGVKEGAEQCDGADFGTATCTSETQSKRPEGALMCKNTCLIDTTNCKTPDEIIKEKLGCAQGIGIKYLGEEKGILDSYGLRLPYCDAPEYKDVNVVCSKNLPGGVLVSCQIYLGADTTGGAGVLIKKNSNYLLPEGQTDDKGRTIQGSSSVGLGGFPQAGGSGTIYLSYARYTSAQIYSDFAIFSVSQGTPPMLSGMFNKAVQNIQINGDTTLTTIQKDQLARDYRRLSFAKRLVEYRKTHVFSLPTDANFSYIKGVTASAWNSWDALQSYYSGIQLETDPLNAYNNTNNICGLNGYDPDTCWNYQTKKAICPVGSHIYYYNYQNNQIQFVPESGFSNWENINFVDGTVGGPACGGDKIIK